jgi:hypothetical protein
VKLVKETTQGRKFHNAAPFEKVEASEKRRKRAARLNAASLYFNAKRARRRRLLPAFRQFSRLFAIFN